MSDIYIQRTDLDEYRLASAPHIIVTKHRGIFEEAARTEPKGHAAVLERPLKDIEEDKKIVKKLLRNREAVNEIKYGRDISYDDTKKELEIHPSLEHARERITELSKSHCDLAEQSRSQTALIRDWRLSAGEIPHESEHSWKVTNLVLFSTGTFIKTSEGYYQTPEGFELFMQEGCNHEPEFETEKNRDVPRFTIVTYCP